MERGHNSRCHIGRSNSDLCVSKSTERNQETEERIGQLNLYTSAPG